MENRVYAHGFGSNKNRPIWNQDHYLATHGVAAFRVLQTSNHSTMCVCVYLVRSVPKVEYYH